MNPRPTVWDSWNDSDYLSEYYAELGAENEALLGFYARAYEELAPVDRLLDFGSGPTIYALISAAKKVREIHVCDFLEANLKHIARWRQGDEESIWAPYFEQALRSEGHEGGSDAVRERESLLRGKIACIGKCDAFAASPLDRSAHLDFDVVSTNFCPESITGKREDWLSAVKSIFGLLKDGGTGMMCALNGASWYAVGPRRFPAVSITMEEVVEAMIHAGFDPESLEAQIVKVSGRQGYKGITMILGRKLGQLRSLPS